MEFDKKYYQQKIGTAMGTKPAPSYANTFMAKRIDPHIVEIALKYQENGEMSLKLFKRFLDDIFLIFVGGTKRFHKFFEEINKIHPSIKFTMSHTSLPQESKTDRCQCDIKDAISFLDTQCSIEKGKIDVDLFRKETDRNQYLLSSSIHPIQCTKNIPYSLSLRIIRICTNPNKRDARLIELKQLLMDRKYNENMVDSAISRARKVPRHIALRKVAKPNTHKRPIFAVTYDPRLPHIPSLIAKHWHSMAHQDSNLASVFKKPHLIACKRARNLKDIMIRAKVPDPLKRYPERKVKGMSKCGTNCTACPFIMETKNVKIDSKTTWNLNSDFKCGNSNIVYLLECNIENCKKRYIGESGRELTERLSEHRGYIFNKKLNQATGEHFNLPGHGLQNLKCTVLEQVKKNCILYRKEREKYFIRKFNTYHKGW